MPLLKWPPPPPPLAITGNVPREIITATAASDAVTAFKVELRMEASFSKSRSMMGSKRRWRQNAGLTARQMD
jgi:hypothetical protein